MVDKTSTSKGKARWLMRVRHVAWAGLIALVLNALLILDPVDQFLWTLESRINSGEASGEIVFVGVDSDIADPDMPEGRTQLASVINRLDDAGARAVYLNVGFRARSTHEADARLNTALRSFSGSSFLVRDLETSFNGEEVLHANTPAVGKGVSEVGADAWKNYLGLTWSVPFSVSHNGETLPNLPASIAGVRQGGSDFIPIRYDFDLVSIPTYRYQDLTSSDADFAPLAGKTVVIGASAARSREASNIPGHKSVPKSIVAIYAAETLNAGPLRFVSGFIPVLVILAALLCAVAVRYRRLRYVAYGAIGSIAFATPMFAPQVGLRMQVAYMLAVLLVYSLFRARTRWQQTLLLVDPDTNLPTFAALEADDDTSNTVPAIVVARIHRFEEVRRTLPAELHADYMLAITARLKAATQDATIYLGQGHLIAWTMTEKDPALMREHLEGLRALFASPLVVAEEQVDVGITFGIDITPSPNVARRLASAIAVAEKTNETFEPIAIADMASQEDLIWNISLQARIDAALENGEIYLAYQPKVMLQSGEIVGAEALVRWKDPVKGHIPPDFFIRQCETAGRMSQLTRFVLTQACQAGIAFENEGLHLPIAVNISATLLHERSIVAMVSQILDETGFDPRRLTLEITETYRISNLDLAAEILNELKALGTKISMDDFGVGAASLEALLRLPFSELKIDRLFIAPMATDPKALGIVKNVLQMGRDLRIIVVAEGVEDQATLTLLRDSGCIVAQGFAISRPVKLDQILEIHGNTATEPLRNIV